MNNDGCKALANAIIILAAKDYRAALRRLFRDPDNRMAAEEVKNLEKFFHSPWYEFLTNVNGDYLIKKLREEEEKYENQSKDKSIRERKNNKRRACK